MKSRIIASLALAVAATVAALLAPLATASANVAVAACGNADLKASYRYSDSGAGHTFGWIVLTNRSDHTCRTGGFSGISYVGGTKGKQVGSSARWEGPTHGSLTLQPGGRLRESLSESHAANYPKRTCTPRHVDGFRVYVPNATRSQYVPHPTTGCASTGVRLLVAKALARS